MGPGVLLSRLWVVGPRDPPIYPKKTDSADRREPAVAIYYPELCKPHMQLLPRQHLPPVCRQSPY